MIRGWGGKWHSPVNNKKAFAVVGRDLPKMLKEGEYHLEYTNELRVISENSKSLCVWDSSGREWTLPKAQLKALKQEARTLQAANPSTGQS